MVKKIATLLVFVLLIISLSGCGGSQSNSSNNSQSEDAPTLGETMKDPEREEQIATQKNLTVGETGEAQGVKVTLDRVYLTEGDNNNATELQPNHIFMVCVLTIQNDSSESFVPSLASETFTANDTVCEQAFITTSETSITMLPEIAPGKNGTGSVVFQVPQDANQFELKVRTNTFTTPDEDELVFKFDTNQVS